MDNITLKQCPFCGSSSIMDADNSYYHNGWKVFVLCTQCFARGGYVITKEKPGSGQENARKMAAEKWNQRKGQGAGND